MATEPGLGTSERSLMRLCGPRVVPAKAGTHTPRLKEGALRQTPSATINIGGYGSRRSPGRRQKGAMCVHQAVAAWANSSSSSSSTGAKVESGLVESVIGLPVPEDNEGAGRTAGLRASALRGEPTRPPNPTNRGSLE